MNKLDYIIAQIGFGTAKAHVIQKYVNDLLMNGEYADEFLDIIDSKLPRLDEVLPPFKVYLKNESILIPVKEKALWQLIEHHISQIDSKKVDPWTGLESMIQEVYWEYDFGSITQRYLGDSHGIEQLIGIYWEVDYWSDSYIQKNLNIKILESAKDWLTKKSILETPGNDIEDFEKYSSD